MVMQFKDAEIDSQWSNDKGQVFKVLENKGNTIVLEMVYPQYKKFEVPSNQEFEVKMFRSKRAWGKVEGTRAKIIHEELLTGGTVDDLLIRVAKRTGDTDMNKVRKHIIARISYLRGMKLLKEEGKYVRSLENQKEV